MTSGTPVLPGLADLSPLGAGGLADVYRARQIHLERWVAAKIFRVALTDEQAADRFRAECRALGRIDTYPNIVTVYDAGVLPDGRPFLISELCDGSLADLVAVRGPLPPGRVAEIGRTVARALQFAHSCSVLHGDVTPPNVLIRASGAAVLADFGLAVLRDAQEGTAAGFTLAHAAPEVFEPGAAIGAHSDVYGLGSTLYAALTGHAPFPREAGEDDRDRAERIRSEPVVPPPETPGPLGELVVAMLAKQPEDRPGLDRVVETLDDDRTAVAAMPAATAAMPAPAGVATAMAAAASPTIAPPERTRLHSPAPVAARSRSHRRGVLVVALALLALVGGIAVLALSSASGPGTPAASVPQAPASPSAAPVTTTAPTDSARPTLRSEPDPTTPRRTVRRTPAPAPDAGTPGNGRGDGGGNGRGNGNGGGNRGDNGRGNGGRGAGPRTDPGTPAPSGTATPPGSGNDAGSQPAAPAAPQDGGTPPQQRSGPIATAERAPTGG